jgi:PAT family beta-lactamase induction signal transducer AmpG
MLTGNGLIVIIGGYLEQQYGDKQKHGRIPWLSSGYWWLSLHSIIILPPRTETSIAANASEGSKEFSVVF